MRCGNCRRDVSHMLHICVEINGRFYCSQECANKGTPKEGSIEEAQQLVDETLERIVHDFGRTDDVDGLEEEYKNRDKHDPWRSR